MGIWRFLELVYFVIMSIMAYPKYLRVKKNSILTTGKIIDLKDIKYKYKDNREIKILSKTYIYNLEINIGGQKRIAEYSEQVSGDGLSSILKGTSFEVFYNSSDNTAVNVAQLKKAIWLYPLCAVVIAVAVVIGWIIIYITNYKKA
ncbi:MAG: hypothetical protein J1F01_01010 [Oscillospiraceae bacterium]|nr:hypothetical protein [Oscillospiraceae bacterium]